MLGIRPHDLKLGGPGIPGRVQVVERLGTETHVVVGIDAPRLRARALTDAIDAAPDDDVLLAEDDRASFTVVTEARAEVAVGDAIELAVDAARLHGFDLETGEALGNEPMPAQTPGRRLAAASSGGEQLRLGQVALAGAQREVLLELGVVDDHLAAADLGHRAVAAVGDDPRAVARP